MTCFCATLKKNGANMNGIKIGGRNHILSPLGIEAKLINENLLPLELVDLWKFAKFTSSNELIWLIIHIYAL